MQIQDQKTGIYHQIAEFGIDQVLNGQWEAGHQIPSVRGLAAEVGVNPNTVMNAYEQLKSLEILETRRGRGVFVTEGGKAAALNVRRNAFVRNEVPRLRRYLDQLSIEAEELMDLLFPNSNTPKISPS